MYNGGILPLGNFNLVKKPPVTPFLMDAAAGGAEATVLKEPVRLTTAIKGKLGEARAVAVKDYVDYVAMDCRLPGNRGIDHVFVKYAADGAVADIVVVESKYATGGGLPKLAKDSARNQQLSNMWMQKQMGALQKAHPETLKVLKANQDKIRFKANVVDETGINRWYDYGKFDPDSKVATAIKTAKTMKGNE